MADEIVKKEEIRKVEIAKDLPYHDHDGVNSPKIPAANLTFNLNTNTGTGTSPASPGTQQITIGFTPKIIRVVAELNVVGTRAMSIGSATGTTDDHCIYTYHFGTNIFMNFGRNGSAIVDLVGEDGNSEAVATISATDSTSFTLDWTVTDSQCSYSYEAIG